MSMSEFVEDFIHCITSYNWPLLIVTVMLLYPTVLHHCFIICPNVKCFLLFNIYKPFYEQRHFSGNFSKSLSQLTDILSFIPHYLNCKEFLLWSLTSFWFASQSWLYHRFSLTFFTNIMNSWLFVILKSYDWTMKKFWHFFSTVV